MKDILLALAKNPEFMGAVITLIAAVASYLIARVFKAKPAWVQYEGLLINAVKSAEKLIPDGIENTGAERADAALKVFIDRYTNAYGKLPTTEVVTVAKLALPIIHDALEIKGTLPVAGSAVAKGPTP